MIQQFAWLIILLSLLVINIDNNMFIHGQCLNDQSSSLLKLKQSLSFSALSSTTSKLLSWNSSRDCCSWEGVTCDRFKGHVVIGLDLSEEFISGGIENSSTLVKLMHLESLNLAYNDFSPKPIPSGLDQLFNLTHLNLSNSGFSGQVPMGISRMKNLVLLDLSLNNLKLENPNLRTLVRDLSELRELYLDGVNISMNGRDWCQALSLVLRNLKVLSLQVCNLSGPFDSSLIRLGSLSELRLDENNISAVVPEFFGSFYNLTVLHLSSCGLFGTFPEKIFQLPSLRSLDISRNQLLQGSMPAEFPQNGSLEVLVISFTNFSGMLLPHNICTALSSLSKLELNDCGFSGTIPPCMSNFTQLLYLDLSSNNFTGLVPHFSSSQLIYLDVSSNNFIGPVPHFSSSENLTFINLANNRLTGPISSLQWDKHLKLKTVNLRNNSLNGTIPVSLFTLPLLKTLYLSHNQFTGQLGEFQFTNRSSSVLDDLDLNSNRLEGIIPSSIFQLASLIYLSLSSNNFNGTIRLSMFQKFKNLSDLDLSGNKLSINSGGINSSLFPQVSLLSLASCKLTEFPDFFKNQWKLDYLDLSNNQIRGKIPNWIWQIGNGYIAHLNLSLNFLENPDQPLPSFHFKWLVTLDLHSNMLQGSIPILPPTAGVLDYSNNNLTSIIPVDIGSYLQSAIFLSLSHNFLKGEIPMSVCEGTSLRVLDLSDNGLRGSIPRCLSDNLKLGVLNLRSNNLHSTIPEPFREGCSLKTLDLNGNRIEGEISKSLSNCTMLEVLDLGNNQITGTFPLWLGELAHLRVLVLRSNNLYGHIGHWKSNKTFNMFQIIDISSNKFTGSLPAQLFLTWKGMMTNADDNLDKYNQQILRYEFQRLGRLYYQDAVTVASKGMQMELLKILTIFTSIDMSNNRFEGEIPKVIGDLTKLYTLNLSHNVLTG